MSDSVADHRSSPPPARVDRTRLTVASGPLAGPVISRVVGIHAARAQLPVDRLADAILIADALAARAPAFVDGDRLPISVQSSAGRLEIRVGPLRADGADRLLAGAALPEVGAVIERLADSVAVRPGAGGSEYLVLRLTATTGEHTPTGHRQDGSLES